MYISELIKKLQLLKAAHGEIMVTAEDSVGEFNVSDCKAAFDPDTKVLSANLSLLVKR